MSATGLNPTRSGTGFLSFNSMPPRLHVTADDDEFDEAYIQQWKDEGFDVTYLPLGPGGKAYANDVRHLADDLELGEAYAIVAFGTTASLCLEIAQKPLPHCCALVCYYPPRIPNPNAKYPTQVQLVCHLAGDQNFQPSWEKCYRYAGTAAGFAESDLDEYDKVAARLSWSRSLAVVRRGFKMERDLEEVRDKHVASEFMHKDAVATLSTMVSNPYVNHIPTLTGGIGARQLLRFYRDFFIPGNPPSLNIRLISRTQGVDRIIDEMVISFRHTQEIPWMLPGVPPTNKYVEVALVSMVKIRGTKLEHEHVYWDQASVLVQVGLLDPKMVPENMKKKGMERLPVAGAESAKKVLNEESEPSNQLIPKW